MNTQYTKPARQAVANAGQSPNEIFRMDGREAFVWFDSYWFQFCIGNHCYTDRYRTATAAAEALDAAWTLQ